MQRFCTRLFPTLGVILSFGTVALAADGAPDNSGRTYLHNGWQIQSSCQTTADGAAISAAGFDPKGWHTADIPATVVGALVTDKTYPDPNYGAPTSGSTGRRSPTPKMSQEPTAPTNLM